MTKHCHSFRVTRIYTPESHRVTTVINKGISRRPTYWSAPPPQTQFFFPAFQFPKDWIPQVRWQDWVSGSMPRAPEVRIQDGSHLLGQGTRKPHKSTLAALGQAMPAPLGTGSLLRNPNRAWAQLTLYSSLLGQEKDRRRRKKREGQDARDRMPEPSSQYLSTGTEGPMGHQVSHCYQEWRSPFAENCLRLWHWGNLSTWSPP